MRINSFFNKLYDIENFKKFDNFYTMIGERQNVFKRFYNSDDIIIERYTIYERLIIFKELKKGSKPIWVLIGSHNKITPIFGHFADNNNYFVYCYLNQQTFRPLYSGEKYSIPKDRLEKPQNSEYYCFKDVEDFKPYYYWYKSEIQNQKNELYENMSLNEHFIDLYKTYYEYNNGKITHFLEQNDLRFILNGNEIKT